MDNKQIIKDYEEFVIYQYGKIKSRCQSYGELKKQIEKAGRDLCWKHGTDLWKMMEQLLQKEIDGVLETLPIPEIKQQASKENRCREKVSPYEKMIQKGIIAHSIARQVAAEGVTVAEAITILKEAIDVIQRGVQKQQATVPSTVTDSWGAVIAELDPERMVYVRKETK